MANEVAPASELAVIRNALLAVRRSSPSDPPHRDNMGHKRSRVKAVAQTFGDGERVRTPTTTASFAKLVDGLVALVPAAANAVVSAFYAPIPTKLVMCWWRKAALPDVEI
jgi:hypothetical protein